jgi:hypothetical protein
MASNCSTFGLLKDTCKRNYCDKIKNSHALMLLYKHLFLYEVVHNKENPRASLAAGIGTDHEQ